jgi:hypothetical protein
MVGCVFGFVGVGVGCDLWCGCVGVCNVWVLLWCIGVVMLCLVWGCVCGVCVWFGCVGVVLLGVVFLVVC